MNNRLTAELDAYHKLTDGILTTAPIYLTVGDKDAPTANIAKVANKGFEVTIGWKDHIGKVNYSISGNFAYNNNKVTKYKGKLEKAGLQMRMETKFSRITWVKFQKAETLLF